MGKRFARLLRVESVVQNPVFFTMNRVCGRKGNISR